jgi:hypothetical protein
MQNITTSFENLSTKNVKAATELGRYQEIGKNIKTANGVEYQALNKCIEDVYALKDITKPSILADGPSGVGKTQAAFCIDRPVIHLLLSQQGDGGQVIYQAFEGNSVVFRDAVVADLSKLPLNDWSTTSLVNSHFTKKFQSLAVIANLMNVGGGRSTMSICDLRNILADKDSDWKRPVFVLDETPPVGQVSEAFIGLARNIFRVTGLCVIMMGTDSTAANMVMLGNGSRGTDDDFVWAYLVVELPKFVKGSDQSYLLPPYVENELLTVRPWFAKLMIDFCSPPPTPDASSSSSSPAASSSSSPAAPSSSLQSSFNLDKLRTHVRDIVLKAKFSQKKSLAWLRGQLCMLQPMYSVGVTDKIHELTKAFISNHLAFLDNPSGKGNGVSILNLSGGVIKCNSCEWRPSCYYPSSNTEAILFLALSGGFTVSDVRLSTSAAFKEVYSRLIDNVTINCGNPKAVKNDGDYLEALVFTGMIVASHQSGVKGVKLVVFLASLCNELSLKWTDNLIVQDPSNLLSSMISEMIVPFLFPTSAPPDSLKGLGTFGHLERLSDKTKLDKKVVNLDGNLPLSDKTKLDKKVVNLDGNLPSVITVEDKYYKDLQLETMKNILRRVPESSVLHIVVCDNLQNEYFVTKKTTADGVDTTVDPWENFKNECGVMNSSQLVRLSGEGNLLSCNLLLKGHTVSANDSKRLVVFIPLSDIGGGTTKKKEKQEEEVGEE